MIYLAAAIMYSAGIAGTCYFASTGNYVLAGFTLVMTSSIRVRRVRSGSGQSNEGDWVKQQIGLSETKTIHHSRR